MWPSGVILADVSEDNIATLFSPRGYCIPAEQLQPMFATG